MTAYRKLTLSELHDEARQRFGDDPRQWAFRCPSCGDIATIAEFTAPGSAGSGMAGQECIGRHRNDGRGCQRVAYGLIAGPWEVVVPTATGGQTSVWSFPLALTNSFKEVAR